MQQTPKNIFKPFKNRNKAFGKERRLNAVKETLLHQPHFPKPVTYEDIDQTMFNWLDKEIELNYEGRKFPTYKLFSNQRISEYGQNWKELDEKGNLEVNFKTITRENNPQHGDSQGNSYNIPGNREYPIFQTYVAEEKGDEVLQVYTMKQPFAINLIYNVSVITSTYKKLNDMNMKIQDEFKAIEKYIFPNGFAMPCLLNSVSDESEYLIDDRKYYAQTYQIKVLAYIIREEDYKVKKVPSRVRGTFAAGQNSSFDRRFKKYNIEALDTQSYRLDSINDGSKCDLDIKLNPTPTNVSYDEVYNPISGHSEIEIEEYNGLQECYGDTEYKMYVNKKVVVTIPIINCGWDVEFKLEQNLTLETIELKNINEYILYINDIEINIEDSDVIFEKDDTIKIHYSIKDVLKRGYIKLICYDPETVVDNDENILDTTEELVVE